MEQSQIQVIQMQAGLNKLKAMYDAAVAETVNQAADIAVLQAQYGAVIKELDDLKKSAQTEKESQKPQVPQKATK